MKKDEVAISIPRPDFAIVEIPLVSDARLVVHKWSEKAKKQMLDKQMGRAQKKKAAKNPTEDYEGSLYRFAGEPSRYGFPATAFKNTAVAACRYTEGLTMVMARGLVHVLPDGVSEDGVELVEISGDGPHMREDLVRVGMGTADLRYRGEWRTWNAMVRVKFNSNVISAEQVFNLYSLAGYHVGIGEGRPGAPKTSMDWGLFHIAESAEAAA